MPSVSSSECGGSEGVVHSPDDLSIRPIQQEIDRPQANIADARNGEGNQS